VKVCLEFLDGWLVPALLDVAFHAFED
jgi:hypothetical protein